MVKKFCRTRKCADAQIGIVNGAKEKHRTRMRNAVHPRSMRVSSSGVSSGAGG